MVTITIRHISREIREELERRASRRGQSSQEYAAELLKEAVGRPDRLDVFDSIQKLRSRVIPFDGEYLFHRGADDRY